jgi:hypothetical protein
LSHPHQLKYNWDEIENGHKKYYNIDYGVNKEYYPEAYAEI